MGHGEEAAAEYAQGDFGGARSCERRFGKEGEKGGPGDFKATYVHSATGNK